MVKPASLAVGGLVTFGGVLAAVAAGLPEDVSTVLVGIVGAVLGSGTLFAWERRKTNAEAAHGEASAGAVIVTTATDAVALMERVAEHERAAAMEREQGLRTEIAQLREQVEELATLLHEALDAGFRFSRPLPPMTRDFGYRRHDDPDPPSPADNP